MQIKVGCDIVHIPNFKKILARTPGIRKKIFLPQEMKQARAATLAGIFAAKEAVIKALEIQAGHWQTIEIAKHKAGRPIVKLLTFKPKLISRDLSIAHHGEYALAVAVFLLHAPH